MKYLPVLMSPQTLQNRLGTPLADSSRFELVVCCCILIDMIGDKLFDL